MHFHSSIDNSLFERRYNENAESPLTSIEITVVIIRMRRRLISIQRRSPRSILEGNLYALGMVCVENMTVYNEI